MKLAFSWTAFILALEAPWVMLLSGLCLGVSLSAHMLITLPGPDWAWVSVILSGLPIAWSALQRLSHGKITSALLITVAMVASLALGEIFAAGEIAFIMAIGEWLEHRTISRAQKALTGLVALQPTVAHRLMADGAEEITSPEQLLPGDRVRVLPGERIPVDGVLAEGTAAINQAPLTGESLPVDKAPGDALFCGTLNTFGTLVMTVTHVGENTQLQRLVHLLKEAEKRPAPIQRLADRWATWLVPCALAIALIGVAVCFGLGYTPQEALRRGVTVLVVFCPCALVLATPTAIVAAIGHAARRGALIHSGAALEALAGIHHLAFDKTGTLTTAQLTLTDCLCADASLDERTLLARAAAVEAQSEHPLAKAIVAHARAQGIHPAAVKDFQAVPGCGLMATYEGQPHRCGSPRWFAALGIALPPPLETARKRCQSEGKATLLLASGEPLRVMGLLALSDIPRAEAPALLAALARRAITPHLLSGDAPQAVENLASRLAIPNIRANCLPEDKVNYLLTLRQAGHAVAMVGDGLNDAPALKAATIGIAMGTASTDLTRAAADFTLMNDRLMLLPYLIDLARITARAIRLNILLSLAINLVAVTLSLLGWLTPISGALVHNLSSLLVILNAATLAGHRHLGEEAPAPSPATVAP